MKRSLFSAIVLIHSIVCFAQADFHFDKTTHDFGDFSKTEPVQTCTFTFTNVGDEPLVINQVVTSCGCTVPEYSKESVEPGAKGTITVTYNGKNKYTGHFKKSVTVRSNAKKNVVRLYIEGNMLES